MVTNTLRVFVYGTLKPGEVNYNLYCAGLVVEEKRAIAYGQLFALPLGYPAMIPGESPVQGFLLTFADPAMLSALDELEDYDPYRPAAENEYNRQQIEVYDLARETPIFAWAYLMTPEQVQRFQGVPILSGCWENLGVRS
ncbi:MAG: gamma-glutamylcyclotransferase [Symploca sp. SIO2E6]|nr:gamma-glutamylcyclotransferase [Symploca sp. SIO2E6]